MTSRVGQPDMNEPSGSPLRCFSSPALAVARYPQVIRHFTLLFNYRHLRFLPCSSTTTTLPSHALKPLSKWLIMIVMSAGVTPVSTPQYSSSIRS